MTQHKCLLLVEQHEPVDELGPLSSAEIVRVPIHTPDAEARIGHLLGDPQTHAALTVLSAASLSNSALGRCLAVCAHEADARDDFRLFIVLREIGSADVEAAPVPDIARLQTIVQFVAHDDLDAMKKDFAAYLLNLR